MSEVENITVTLPANAATVDLLLNTLTYVHPWEDDTRGWAGIFGEDLQPNKPEDVIGLEVDVLEHTVKIVDVDFGTTTSSYYDSRFHQGYSYDGYIIVEMFGRFWKKLLIQDSYGTLDIVDEPCVEVRRTTKTVEVYSYE